MWVPIDGVYSWLQPEADVVWVALGYQYNLRMRDRWDLGYGDLWIGTIVTWVSAATGLDTIGMDVLNSVDKVCIVECRMSAHCLDLICVVRLSIILPRTLSTEHSQKSAITYLSYEMYYMSWNLSMYIVQSLFGCTQCGVIWDSDITSFIGIGSFPGIHVLLTCILHVHIDGLVQEKHNSSALAMELRLSWTNPSTC